MHGRFAGCSSLAFVRWLIELVLLHDPVTQTHLRGVAPWTWESPFTPDVEPYLGTGRCSRLGMSHATSTHTRTHAMRHTRYMLPAFYMVLASAVSTHAAMVRQQRIRALP